MGRTCLQARLPLFRSNNVYLCYMFDLGEKIEMHRTPTSTFIPDSVDEEYADGYCFMAENSAAGFESICRKDLTRGGWGVSAVSEEYGKPSVFQTETMNVHDMKELKLCSFRRWEGAEEEVDDVNLAVMYKARQVVIMEDLLPKTALGPLEYGSIRLEIQSGRSYRLHAHNLLRFRVEERTLLNCVSASLSSLWSEARAAHAPVSRHRCLTYKCRNGICPYGYPMLEAAYETRREVSNVGDTARSEAAEGSDIVEERIIYKRQIGNETFELDERVTPFCVELSSTRVCHGAFLICTDELATGYAGKYVFKRSGGLGSETGYVSLPDAMRAE